MAIDTTTYQSPNHDARPGGITAIVLHSCEGAPPGDEQRSSLPWLCAPHSGVSCHYYVTREGGVFQLVPDARRAWHAGVSALAGEPDVNDYSLGIELEHRARSAPYPPAQLDALADLIRLLCATYAIPAARVVSHRAIALPAGRKGDPSDWPEAALRVWVAQALGMEPRYTELSPIIGTTQTTALQVADRISGRRGQKYSISEIRDIVTGYYRACTPVGVNPLLAIAQMCHETGYLTSWWCDRVPGAPGRRNPAGIGVNGQTRPASDPHPLPRELWQLDTLAGLWRRGYVFANWTQATVAHVGRLVGYAVAPDARTPAQRAIVHEATETRPLPEMVHGTARVLRLLGSAHNPSGLGWAHPGDRYGAAIAKVANEIGGL